MTDDELSEIIAREKLATPGPWFVPDGMYPAVHRTPEKNGRFYRIASFCAGSTARGRKEQDRNNAVFAAHARHDIPALIQEVLLLRQENSRLNFIVDNLNRRRPS